MTRAFVAALLYLLALASASGGEAFKHQIPLNINEMVGVSRKGDIVSTGVPMPCGALKGVEGIAVHSPAGTPVPAQFRVLERWREKVGGRADKSVKWLLVTFLADVPAGAKATYTLKAGKNPAPKSPVKIEASGGGYRMGGLEFRKDLSAPFVPRLLDPEGKNVRVNDLTWSIWEDGPVRSCLKVESSSAKDRYGLIMWIYAYAGDGANVADRWDVTVVLKNTPHKLIGPLYFKEFSLSWSPKALEGARSFHLGGALGKVQDGTLQGDGAYLYQSGDGTDGWATLSRHLLNKRTGKYKKVGDWTHAYVLPYKGVKKGGKPEFRGYKVFNGGKELAADNWAQGWAGLGGKGKGGLVLVRDFLHQYPKSVEVAEGKLVAGLWPRHWKAHGGAHWLDDCQRKAHDLSFRLVNGKVDAAGGEAASRAFDHPLLIHCGIEWYRKTEVLGYISKRFKEEEVQPVKELIGTGYNWVTYGGDITDRIRRRYHEKPMGYFIRGGSPLDARTVFKAMRHSSGMTPLWPDDYEYPRDVDLLGPGYCSPPRPGGKTGKYRSGTAHHGYMAWNPQHFMCTEIYDGWRLFGDPLAYDAIGDLSVYLRGFLSKRVSKKKRAVSSRIDALPVTTLSHCYRILGDEAILEDMRKFMREVVWPTANKQRGYYVPSKLHKPSVDKPFMLATLMEGIRQYWYLSGDEVAFDLMLGITDFCIAEGFVNEKLGFRYTIPKDLKASRDSLARNREGKDLKGLYGSWQMFRPLAWGYLHTGDREYLETFNTLCRMTKARTKWRRAGSPYPEKADWGYICDRLRDMKQKSDGKPPVAIGDLEVEALGGGKVKLSWKTPPEAVTIRIKHADHPMVRRTNFAKGETGKSNWWGATNVGNEPAPKAGKQEVIVEGVTPGRRVFAIRTLDAVWNRSDLSNQVAIEVK